MGLQFEWQIGDGEQAETLVRIGRRRLPRWVWVALRIVLIAAVVLATGTYLTMRVMYERARRRARSQIEDTLQVEARAYAERDLDRYLAQQDRSSTRWYQLQVLCAAAESPPGRELAPTTRQELCFPPLFAEIEDLELRGDIAWVEVIDNDPIPIRRVRFYRRSDQGWKHTAPDPSFFGDPVHERHDKVIVRYHKRDQPHIAPLLERVIHTADDVSSALRYTLPQGRAQIDFAVQYADLARGNDTEPLYLQDGQVVLFSPWLYGIPVDQDWDQASLDSVTYRIAHGLATAATRPSDNQARGSLQNAIAAEYAVWYTTQDPAQTPILGRIIDRHGEEALPRVFLSLKGAHHTTLFAMRWLSVHPNEATFFETVLNIEREAIQAGLKETFLLFQDERWLAEQGAYFDQTQIENPYPLHSPIQVIDIQFDGDYAYVAISPTPVPLPGHTPQVDGDVVLFHRENWDWKHSSSLLPTPSPGLALTPVPDGYP
jgi:hypothetical protein